MSMNEPTLRKGKLQWLEVKLERLGLGIQDTQRSKKGRRNHMSKKPRRK